MKTGTVSESRSALLSRRQLAHALGLSYAAIGVIINENPKLPAIQVGQRLFFARDEVLDYLKAKNPA